MADVEKKKRGRRRKTELLVSETIKEDVEENIVETEVKKKRGRRPKIYNSSDISVINNSFSDDENIIVRLQVKNPDINSEISKLELNEDQHPYAYNSDMYTKVHKYSNDKNDEDKQCITNENIDNNKLKIVAVLKDFEEKNKNKEWPTNTSIACYWCCHNFINSPFGIPVSYDKNEFKVFGCFCSLECATAYNFKSNDSVDEVWERYNLINLLSRKMGKNTIVKPSPDRLSLKMFGGFLDIDDFRKYTETNKIIHLNFPPMTSLTQQIEEVNEFELNPNIKFIPLDNERINRCREKMSVKQYTISAEKLSLEVSMNVKYD